MDEYEGEMGTYKVLVPIEYTDQDGKSEGVLDVGSIQEVPIVLGDMWVNNGDAEKINE